MHSQLLSGMRLHHARQARLLRSSPPQSRPALLRRSDGDKRSSHARRRERTSAKKGRSDAIATVIRRIGGLTRHAGAHVRHETPTAVTNDAMNGDTSARTETETSAGTTDGTRGPAERSGAETTENIHDGLDEDTP